MEYTNKKVFRMVEGQHFVATRKLVSSEDKHEILENILEKSKPIAPKQNMYGKLHYLLYTPFRYPPLLSGERFHRIQDQGVFYASETLQAAMAEIAYKRLLFALHTEAAIHMLVIPYTHFVAHVASEYALLLHEPPFCHQTHLISHPSSYIYSQRLGHVMREAGTVLCTYMSARAKQSINVAVFSVEAFQYNYPLKGYTQHWSMFVSDHTVEFYRAHMQGKGIVSYSFHKSDFMLDGVFPMV